MHDFLNTQLVTQELDRELNRKRFERFDPDGLAQYAIWDEAFARPSLGERIASFIGRFRQHKKVAGSHRSEQNAQKCLPQS